MAAKIMIINVGGVTEVPVMCSKNHHKYEERMCPECGHIYCWECCLDTNTYKRGEVGPKFMICPECGADYYDDPMKE